MNRLYQRMVTQGWMLLPDDSERLNELQVEFKMKVTSFERVEL